MDFHVPLCSGRTASGGTAGRSDRVLPRAAGAAVLLLLLAHWQPWGGEALNTGASALAWLLSSGAAAWWCLLRARTYPHYAPAWRLLGLGSLAWFAGTAAWTGAALTRSAGVAFPCWADAGMLAFPLLAAPALTLAPGLPATLAGRARLLADGAVLATSLLLVAWLAGFDRAGALTGAPLAGRLAYLALDVIAISVALLVLDRLRGQASRAVRLGSLGVLVVAVADLVYSTTASASGFSAGTPLDALWVVGFVLLAFAARSTATPVPEDDVGVGSTVLPVVPAVVAGVAILVSGGLLTGLDAVLAGLLVVLGAALTARQMLLAVENAALHAALERKVHERTEQLERAHEEVHRRALTDGLTGLPNREGFHEAVAAELPSRTGTSHTAVVLLDLDNFQQVNDGLGHDVGDSVLQAAAERLTHALRGGQQLARLGGDEFAVLLRDLRGPDDAATVARRLIAALREPLHVGPLEVVLGASAGIAVAVPPERLNVPEAEVEVRHVMRDADTALHAAKADGCGQVRVFAPDMHRRVRRGLELEAEFRSALAERSLQVHYQPVVDLGADRVVGFEALVRWTHPVNGPVPPSEFVPAAERSGLVVEMERFVLDDACAQVARWRTEFPALTVAVNVSARHLREPDYLGHVMSVLGRYGLPPSALVLEVTESLLFHDDDDVRQVLDRLHTAGVGLALDDFGTGYSSLSRLAGYPFDTLKVDRAFVLQLDAKPGAAVLTATLAMARGLGMSVVAEGVETPEQLRFLVDSGCDLAQGYLLSRPGPAATVSAMLGRALLPAPRYEAPRSA